MLLSTFALLDSPSLHCFIYLSYLFFLFMFIWFLIFYQIYLLFVSSLTAGPRLNPSALLVTIVDKKFHQFLNRLNNQLFWSWFWWSELKRKSVSRYESISLPLVCVKWGYSQLYSVESPDKKNRKLSSLFKISLNIFRGVALRQHHWSLVAEQHEEI